MLKFDLAVHVGDAAVALGGSIKLADLLDSETLDEGLPHTGPQAIPYSQTHTVLPLGGTHRLRQQITADLSYILDNLEETEMSFHIKNSTRMYKVELALKSSSKQSGFRLLFSGDFT